MKAANAANPSSPAPELRSAGHTGCTPYLTAPWAPQPAPHPPDW